jgi:hypothetical protein
MERVLTWRSAPPLVWQKGAQREAQSGGSAIRTAKLEDTYCHL